MHKVWLRLITEDCKCRVQIAVDEESPLSSSPVCQDAAFAVAGVMEHGSFTVQPVDGRARVHMHMISISGLEK